MYNKADSEKANMDTSNENNLTDSCCLSPANRINKPPGMGAQINKLSSGRAWNTRAYIK